MSAPGIWERKAGDTRDNPYLFLKSPTVVTGASDPIVIPRGRDHIDFECEFTVVIGKRAKYVPVAQALDHIFGYTIQIDVSDRGGRGDRKMGGSDWLVGKNHDTFGPLGPFIVPKEFVKDPMNIRHTFTLNGQVMQDSNTSRMSHNIYELLAVRVEHPDADPRRHRSRAAVRRAPTSSAPSRAGCAPATPRCVPSKGSARSRTRSSQNRPRRRAEIALAGSGRGVESGPCPFWLCS